MPDPIDDGWTQIPTKGKRKAPPTVQPNGLNPPSRDLTLDSLRRDFDAKMKTWKSSTCRKTLFQILERGRPDGGWQVKKAVCLASGSFSRENLECRRRSLWQGVVFVDLVRHLQENEGEGLEIEALAQEPMYTPLDKEFLQSLGIRVLDIEAGSKGLGAAKDVLGRETFVYEPFLDMSEGMLRDLVEAEVGLYIGSSIRGLRERKTEVGSLARRFQKGRRMYKFPVFEVDPNVLEGMEVFWREEEED